MKNLPDIKEEVAKKYSLDFIEILLAKGFEVYLFGGAIRDIIMGKSWKEADIRAILDKPLGERELLLENALKNFVLKGKNRIESLNLTVYRFLPPNSFTTAEIDLSLVSTLSEDLPDFTINSIFFDFRTGKIIDRFGGMDDIKNKLIRTVKNPNTQLVEEPHMMFRVIKFVCQYDFSIESSTFKAIIQNKHHVQKTFSFIASEKSGIFVELFLGNIFKGLFYNPFRYFDLLIQTELYAEFLKFIKDKCGITADMTLQVVNPFSQDRTYKEEDSLSIFLSTLASQFKGNQQKAFDTIITALQIISPKQYSDFIINASRVRCIVC